MGSSFSWYSLAAYLRGQLDYPLLLLIALRHTELAGIIDDPWTCATQVSNAVAERTRSCHPKWLFNPLKEREKETRDLPLKPAQADQTRHDTSDDPPVPWPVPVLVAKVADGADDGNVDYWC